MADGILRCRHTLHSVGMPLKGKRGRIPTGCGNCCGSPDFYRAIHPYGMQTKLHPYGMNHNFAYKTFTHTTKIGRLANRQQIA